MHTIRTVTWRGMTQERALAGALSGTLGTLLEGMLSELVRGFPDKKALPRPPPQHDPQCTMALVTFMYPGPYLQHSIGRTA